MLWIVIREIGSLEQEAQLRAEREISPYPVYQDRKSVSEAYDRDQMNEHPSQPCRKSGKFKCRQIYDGAVTSYGRHRAFVVVAERTVQLVAVEIPGEIDGLLNRYLSELRVSGGKLRVFCHDAYVAYGINSIYARQAVVAVYGYAVSTTSLYVMAYEIGRAHV